MWRFNEDLLFLIFEKLKNDKKSLYSCLLVNRTWCVTAVPFLWRNPSQFYYATDNSKNILYNVILLHLSKESRVILKNQGMNNLITDTTYQRPLFDYISFWKYLELYILEDVISSKMIEKSNAPILRNEILKLFINKNTKFIQLSIPRYFDYQLHLIPEAKCCFSELGFFHCDVKIDQNILEGLAKICKSIKKITLYITAYDNTDNYGIFKLIEVQKSLNEFCLFDISSSKHESFYKSLEESLIKHADTVQYLRISWNPTTRFLSYFVNLLYLEIHKPYFRNWNDPNNLKNLSLPILKILKVDYVPLIATVNLIENTTGNLSEISIHCDNVIHYVDCKILIQAIYQNCPNIRYLKLSLDRNLLIPEFENLLISCQFLNGLIINVCKDYEFSWDKLFQILAKSSPISLFKFKFYFKIFKLKDIESFFSSWTNRNPILLKINHSGIKVDQKLVNLIEEYKAKGVIKKYSFGCGMNLNENFEWI
ncbi:hypothetical protein RhiirC2_811789 [Rhizophagus irregularis]|uniref:F-box domain-containing protein n=1 Tax=Rhizophagus irregularis TaxID=588596 RepID=A0A2N1MQV8_9GLOM|nr:hypothetical protein RhiirC2_811789 [Rhizophagus irregularis]